jgi:tetratricopeptide (TPR) repeat protein
MKSHPPESVPTLTPPRSRLGLALHLLWLLPGCVAALWSISDRLVVPPLTSRTPAQAALTVGPAGRLQLGDCYAFRRGPLSACYLAGEPEARGWALARFFPQAQADPYPSTPFLLAELRTRWLAWRYRESLARIPEEVQAELAGQAFPGARSRSLVAQLAYDLIPRTLTRRGASAVGWGQPPWLVLAWEWPGGQDWDAQKAVLLIQPTAGRRFLCLTRPGQWGALAGLNEAGVGVCVLPAPRTGRVRGGLAAGLLARQVLAEAGGLDEAVELIRRAPAMLPQSYLLGEGPRNRVVVVEKGMDRTVVRPLNGRTLLAGQAFQAKEWSGEPGLPRPARFKLRRLEYLLATAAQPVTAAVLAGILRDRQAVYGGRLGLGNPSAINSLTAVQVVILDLRQRRLWVAAAPHQLGAFVPFDLDDFPDPPSEAPIPEDPLISSGGYARYLTYLQGRLQAEQLLQRGRWREALMQLQEIQPLNPLDYEAHLLAARALRRLGRADEARYNYEQARRLQPAYRFELQEIEAALPVLTPSQP